MGPPRLRRKDVGRWGGRGVAERGEILRSVMRAAFGILVGYGLSTFSIPF